MDSQGQFSLSHILGPSVDVTHYGTLQHQLHSYNSSVGSIAAVGSGRSPHEAPVAHPHSTVTLSFPAPHPSQPAPGQSYGVALPHQVPSHSQVQYFYETAEPLPPHLQPPTQPAPHPHLQVRYTASSVLGFQPVSSPLPVPCTPTTSRKDSDGAGASASASLQGNNAKKRKPRTEGTCAKLSRKRCRNRGEAYVNAAGKFVPAKKYVDLDCQCKNKCLSKLGTEADRENIFRRFWDIGDFGKQNAYLAESVVLAPSKAARQMEAPAPADERNLKTVRRFYFARLSDSRTRVRVCKSQFLRLHGVSNGRLDRVLQALHCECPHALQDRRGQHPPSNKTAKEDVECVVQHLLLLRQRRQEAHPHHQVMGVEGKEISVKKMYELYRRWCEAEEKVPVSLWVYRQIQKSKGCLERKDDDTITAITTPPEDTCNQTAHKTCRSEEAANVCQRAEEAVTEPGVTTATTVGITTLTPASTDTTTTSTATLTNISTSATSTPTQETAQKKRRMKRREGSWRVSMTKEERKTRRNKGEAYVMSSGVVRGRKVYQDKECGCRYKCIPTLGTLEARRHVFDTFWGLASFTRQNMYIAQMVVLVPLGQQQARWRLTRTYTRIYNIRLKAEAEVVRVCKQAFLCLHGLSNGRVDRVLQAVACQSPFALKDRRGRHSPRNKTQEEDVSYVCGHIRTFPLEDPGQSSRLSLPQDLTVEKMYRLYREQCVNDGRRPVGSFVYRRILKERFNCHIRSPANKTPERDLEFACQHIQSSAATASGSVEDGSVGGGGDGGGSPLEASVRRLHRDYLERCSLEGRKPVGIDVFRKICISKFPMKAKH